MTGCTDRNVFAGSCRSPQATTSLRYYSRGGEQSCLVTLYLLHTLLQCVCHMLPGVSKALSNAFSPYIACCTHLMLMLSLVDNRHLYNVPVIEKCEYAGDGFPSSRWCYGTVYIFWTGHDGHRALCPKHLLGRTFLRYGARWLDATALPDSLW